MGFAARSSRRSAVLACAIAAGMATIAPAASAQVVSANQGVGIPPDTPFGSLAICPASQTAIAAGVDSDGLDDVVLEILVPTLPWPLTTPRSADPGSYVAQDHFSWVALNYGPVEHSFMSASICALFSATTIVGAPVVVPAGDVGADRVLCPPGSFATGGGIDLPTRFVTSSDGPVLDDGSADGVRLVSVADGPGAAPIGWRASGRTLRLSIGDWNAQVAVTCISHALTTQIASVTVPAGGRDSKRALCPAGTFAYGGGVDDDGLASATVMATAPVFDDGTATGQRLISRPVGIDAAPIGWVGTLRNDDTTDHTLKVAAICPEPIADELGFAALIALFATRRMRRERD